MCFLHPVADETCHTHRPFSRIGNEPELHSGELQSDIVSRVESLERGGEVLGKIENAAFDQQDHGRNILPNRRRSAILQRTRHGNAFTWAASIPSINIDPSLTFIMLRQSRSHQDS
jgi:hypothetical protein